MIEELSLLVESGSVALPPSASPSADLRVQLAAGLELSLEGLAQAALLDA